MWPFNSDNTDEREERIKELEATVAYLDDDKSDLEHRINSLEREVEELESRNTDLRNVLNDVLGPDTDVKSKVPDLRQGFRELDTACVAYKATRKSIVKLIIPEGATVVYPSKTTRNGHKKLRTDEAIVAGFYDPKNITKYHQPNGAMSIGFDVGTPIRDLDDCNTPRLKDHSKYDDDFTYRIGETVTPEDDLNTDTGRDCESGIHFFRTVEGALDWI